jgi:hypothetical protein
MAFTGSEPARQPMAIDKDRKTRFLLQVVKWINPLVSALLKSRLHGLVSKDILLLHFKGRKSGHWYATPVSYVQDDNRLRVFTEAPWWKNLRGGNAHARVHLRGKLVGVRPTTYAEGGTYVEDAIRDFLTRVPRDARYYGVRMNKDGTPNEDDVKAAAPQSVMIELALPE